MTLKKDDLCFSIITIVYNGEDYITNTIISVINQTYSNIEYIVIDGNSTDQTPYIIDKFSGRINRFVSENDNGIYDAMNKGLSFCNGDYVIFMNGGDYFANENVLKDIYNEIVRNKYDIDFIYGDAIITDTYSQTFFKKARSYKYAWYGMFTNHQAMIYKHEIIKKYKLKYDISYKISADYKFTLEFLKYSKNIHYLPIPICNFSLDGVSNSQKQLGLLEAEKAREEILNYSKFKNYIIRQMLYLSRFLNENLTTLYKFIRYKN